MKPLRAAALALWAAAGAAVAQPALHRYPDADLKLGEQLIREHKCSACHVQKVGGDGSAIYRRSPPDGRVGTPAALLSMVQRCATELNLQLFPEDVAAIAGVLQRDHYRFPAVPAAGAKP
jgi:mono/diheme cytochrome c family protein